MSENSENDPQTAMDVEQPEETPNSSKSEVSEVEVAKPPHPPKKTASSKAPKKDNAAEKRKEELKAMIEEALAAAKATADAAAAQAPTKKRKASSSVGASASKAPAKKAKTTQRAQLPKKTTSSLNKTLQKGKGKNTVLGKKVTKSKSGPITARLSKKPTQAKAPKSSKASKATAPAPQRQREPPQGKLSEPRVTSHVSAKPVDHRLNSFYSQILGR